MEPVVSQATPPRSPAREYTRADLDDIPDSQIAEIIDGRLYVSPRPRFLHANVSGEIHNALFGPYQKGVGGPGGWWIVMEPGIELPGAPEIIPDVAGWRRDRMPKPPLDTAIRIAPDWVCEVHSPSTKMLDVRKKKPFYARVGVRHLWLIDGGDKTLSVNRLTDGLWTEVGNYGIEDRVRAEPFEAVELILADWWPPELAP